jgi:hypothetical protein
MKVRRDILYSVYLFFAAAIILRYGWHVWQAIRGRDAEEGDVAKATSGL